MIKIHAEIEQGSDEWLALRCGLITASVIKDIMTLKTKKPADNDKSRAIFWELAAQKVSGHVEPQYISDAMLRGHEDEVKAKIAYAKKYAPLHDVGFITNDEWGFTLGCSPDGLVGDTGGFEAKSRAQKYQFETIANDKMPDEFFLQIQASLLITGREWWDFCSYSAGWPMYIKRVYPCVETQAAIIDASRQAYEKINEHIAKYQAVLAANDFVTTEREIEQEIVL